MYSIRRLCHADVADFRRLRHSALVSAPSAFTTSLATEEALTEAQQRDRIEGPSLSAIWGAFAPSGVLVGSAGLLHHTLDKVRHKATLYTVYVAPSARGAGLARPLVQAALDYAAAQPALQQVLLSVTASNARAHQLYGAMGFVAYGQEPNAIVTEDGLHDQILMWLPLRNSRA